MKDTVHQWSKGPEAVIKYGSPEFEVVRPGTYVTCAITGQSIPIEQLRYWSVELQEAYVNAAASNQRSAQGLGKS
jgi:hypothetical protein